MGKDVFEKYRGTGKFILSENLDNGTSLIFIKRKNDYLLATSEGEEFPLPYETLDKVRDIVSGNMRDLTEYESKVFEKFNNDYLLRTLAEQSMLRHFEKECIEIDARYQIILDFMLSPNSLMSWSLGKTEEERKKKIEKFFQDNFGVKIDASDEPFTKLLIKLSSDQSYDRRKFLKEALKKERIDNF